MTRTANAARTASPSIDRRRIKERDASRRDWQIELLADETLDDVLKPEFLAHKADVLMPGDRVAIVGSELSLFAEIIIVEADEALGAVRSVVLFGPVDLASRIADAEQFSVEGIQIDEVAAGSFRLRRGAKVISSGFKTRKLAQERLEEIKAGRSASRPGDER
jgi:hypothetical protein